ncbi:MAG: hypothetical protein MR867_06520 [Eubacterium sp.]|nr:hypothetical protein [Eubacterium sp.]MDD7210171.1 hypothetical protein [Lachnospiraceae bacterium]MDY5497438.1 hypothetical protein [Anaerobutyricum sp.]
MSRSDCVGQKTGRGNMVDILKIKCPYDGENLFSFLKIEKEGEQNNRIKKRIPFLFSLVEKAMEIRSVRVEGEKDFITGIREVDECKKQILCLIYSSQSFVRMIEEMTEQGEYLDAYLLQEIGTWLIFRTGEMLCEKISRTEEKNQSYLTSRYFPGEKGIPIELQENFLQIIKRQTDIPVGITKGGMLVPEKSMIFCLGSDPSNQKKCLLQSCKNCMNKKCSYRKKD